MRQAHPLVQEGRRRFSQDPSDFLADPPDPVPMDLEETRDELGKLGLAEPGSFSQSLQESPYRNSEGIGTGGRNPRNPPQRPFNKEIAVKYFSVGKQCSRAGPLVSWRC
jgi:hypothetical protein